MSNSEALSVYKTRRMLIGTSILAIAASQSPAFAQPGVILPEEARESADEIVVSATRRGDQSLLDVGLAVDAVSGIALEDYKASSLQDLSRLAPALNVQSYGAAQQQLIIRGISSNVGGTTGVYLDESPMLGGFEGDIYGDGTPGLRLHDIDRAEVLKGPQGTLFGAGSMDGTVRLVTRQPVLDAFEGRVDGSYAAVNGGNGFGEASLVLNVPLVTDHLGVRAVVWGEEGGGYIDQSFGANNFEDANDVSLYGGRVTVLWRPDDRLSITGSVNHQDTEVDGVQAWTRFVGPTTVGVTTPSGPFSPYENHHQTQEPFSNEYTLASLTAEYALDAGTFTASASYGKQKTMQPGDSTSTGCVFGLCSPPILYVPNLDFTDWTGEVRFSSSFEGPFQFVVGAYYQDDQTDYTSLAVLVPDADGLAPCFSYGECHDAGLALPGVGNSVVLFSQGNDFSAKQYAVYGQADYEILPNFTGTFGIRYFSADVRQIDSVFQNIAPTVTPNGFDGGYVLGAITTPYIAEDVSSTNSKTTFNIALLWKADENLSFYARAASGFRIGGVNSVAALAAAASVTVPSSYEPDDLWDYELGVKAYLMDRRAQLDLSLFHIDWTNQQLDANAAGTFNYTLNGGSTNVNGAEFSLALKPGDGFDIALSTTYVDATLGADLPADVIAAGTPGFDGDSLPYVAKWSFSGRVSYEHSLTGDLTGYMRGSFGHRGESNTAFNSTDPTSFMLPSYQLVDLVVGVRSENWDISVFSDNVFNEVAYLGARSNFDGVRVYSVRPRTVGVRLSASF